MVENPKINYETGHEEESNIELALKEVVSAYLDQDDAMFIDVELQAVEDIINYVYGRLLELGEDPDVILKECGVTEEEDSEI